jgi:succinoglycan biosynthesis protein ExoV
VTCARLGRLEHRLAAITAERLVARATLALARATRMAPQLSPDRALDRCQSRMLDAVAALHRQPCHPFSAHRRSRLQAAEDSAYQLELTG